MELRVNGKEVTVSSRTIRDLLIELDIEPIGIVVERNLEVVPVRMHESVLLCDGDRIEIVHLVGGG